MEISNPRDIAKSCVKLFKNDPNTAYHYIMIFIEPNEYFSFLKNGSLRHVIDRQEVEILENINTSNIIDFFPTIISIYLIYHIRETNNFTVPVYSINQTMFYGCNEKRIKQKFDIIFQIKKMEIDIIKANENFELLESIKSKMDQIEKIKELNKTLKFHQYKFNDIILKTLEQKYIPPPRAKYVPKLKPTPPLVQPPRRGTRNRKEPDRLTYTFGKKINKNNFGTVKFTLEQIINDPVYFNCNSESSLIEALLKIFNFLVKDFNEINIKNVKNMNQNELLLVNTRLQTELDRVSQETRTKMYDINQEHDEQVKLNNILRLATKYNKNMFEHI